MANARGRPSSLTEEVEDKLLYAISLGLTLEGACQYAGIAYTTLRNWINRAESEIARVAAKPRRKIRKREAPFVTFYEKYHYTIAESEAALVQTIQIAADGGHVYTERTFREKKQANAKGQMVVVEEMTTETTKILNPDWRAALAMLERRFPDRWVRATIVKGEKDAPIGVTAVNPYAKLDDGDLNDQLKRELAKLDAGQKNRPDRDDQRSKQAGDRAPAPAPEASQKGSGD